MLLQTGRYLASTRPLRWALWILLIGFLTLAVTSGIALGQENDPSGAATIEADPNAAVNFAWTLVAAFLVFFMQAGFALLEAGSVRSKGVVNVLTKNVMDFIMAALAYWAFGFALMFGGSGAGAGLADGNDFWGFSGFFLTENAYDVSTIQLWMFQVVFAATAATIVSGAMGERTKINAYMAYSFLISGLIYPIYGHWVWGGGWLAVIPFLDDYSAVDFAGSGVVHAVGGTAALVGALMLGPRIGKFGPDGKPRSIPGHNAMMIMLGTLILFVGWFGFNSGSTLAATELRISVIAVNTFLAACGGGLAAYYIRFAETGKADLPATCSGIIGGLVAITAPAAWVEPWAALVIGLVAGPIVVYGARALERFLKLDDPVWAVACHMLAGLWGILSVGIFADGTYGNYTTEAPYIAGLIKGDTTQILAQLLSMAVVVTWTGVTSAAVFFAIKRTTGLRVSEEDELTGVDVTEHTGVAYPEMPALGAEGGGE